MNLRKAVYKRFGKYILQPAVKWWLRRERTWSCEGVLVRIQPGVFHPGWFISTKFLMRTLSKEKDLPGKSMLELGAGSGFLSVYAARNGMHVLATDINPAAAENVKLNAQLNSVQLEVRLSDLFASIPEPHFDYILINPPYYPGEPATDAERAWFCGAHFEYFEQLFHQLSQRDVQGSKIWMVLSEDCDLKSIEGKAGQVGLGLAIWAVDTIRGETNTIYRIVRG